MHQSKKIIFLSSLIRSVMLVIKRGQYDVDQATLTLTTSPPTPTTIFNMFDVTSLPFVLSKDNLKAAKQDWFAINRHIRHAKCRRASPLHALPNEAWRILLSIFPKTKRKPELAGVGANKTISTCPVFQRMTFHVLCLMRLCASAPVQSHLSQSFSLPKRQQSEVSVPYDSQRTIHTLDPVGKAP